MHDFPTMEQSVASTSKPITNCCVTAFSKWFGKRKTDILVMGIVTVVSLVMIYLLRDRILNFVDALFILAMPAAWLSTILSIRKLWQVKSSKSWSIPAWCIGLGLLTLSYTRAIVSIGDFLLIFHLSIIWVLNVIQQILIIKYRNNEGVKK